MKTCVANGCKDKSVVATFTETAAKGCKKCDGGVPAGF